MWNISPSLLLRYGLPVLAVVVAGALTYLLPGSERGPTPLFFAAVMASAWCGGLTPGLLATLLSALFLAYFFCPPVFSLSVGLADGVRLGVFVAVAALISSLNAARRRLEGELRQRDRRKDQFLAVLAEELRAPLTACVRAVATLRPEVGDQHEVHEALDLLDRQLRSMDRLAEELLDVASVGQGKLRLLKIDVDLAEVIQQAAETVQPLLPEGGCRLTLRLPETPLHLVADPVRLEQVVVRLLVNAARYNHPGGNIWLTAGREDGQAVLRVRDSGIGFDSAAMPHLYPLSRNGEVSPGCLGLNLVWGLVQMHGGTVTAHSDGINKGSEFIVRLPLPEEPAKEQAG